MILETLSGEIVYTLEGFHSFYDGDMIKKMNKIMEKKEILMDKMVKVIKFNKM